MRAATPNPITSGNLKDRTGAAGIQRRASAEIRRRWTGLQKDVLAAFDGIQTLAVNDTSKTLYMLTPEQMQSLSIELQAALARWIADGRDPAHIAWWSGYVQESSQLGAAQSVANLTQLSASYAASRALETVIYSVPYKNRLSMAQIKSQDHWTSLAAKQRADLTGIIGRAVVDGKNPKAVRTEIMEKLEVGRARAALYGQTDITNTLREARQAEADYAKDELGLKIALLWTSALLPSTRQWHAARNGKVYTTDEVKQFYSVNGNRYNCYLPGTRVAGRFVAGAKSRYKGPAVRLVTASGRELAVTANHPVMTSRGLVAAAEIGKGDNLIAYLGQQEDPTGVIDLNGELVGSRIEDVFSALVDSGHQRLARVRRVDFHGDAAFMQPEINVVDADLVLTVATDASLAQLLDDLSFVHPDSPAARGRALEFFADGNISKAGGSVCIGDVGTSLLHGHVAVAGALSLAASPGTQSCILDGSHDHTSIHTEPLAHGVDRFTGGVSSMEFGSATCVSAAGPLVISESEAVECLHQSAITDADAVRDILERFAGLASFDEVVDVVWSEYDGHVFDLQELSGLMLGSGIVASNCHCGQTECLLDAEGKPILTKKLQSTMANELATWKKSNPS